MSDEKAFMDVLQSCNDACAEMDFSDDKWKPLGGFDVQILDVLTGSKPNKAGVVFIWVKPVFEIISDGEFQGRTFSEFMYIEPGVTEIRKAMGLQQLLRLATCLAGREIKNAIEAAQIVQAAKGEFISLETYDSTVKKEPNKGKVYRNLRYLSRLESTETTEVTTNAAS
jgi:hypothetical protein